MSSHEQQAQTLIEALPYIQKFTGKTVVVKYGGNAMVSDTLRRSVMSDIVLLNLVGIRVVAVHGGGPEISAMLKMIGHESRFVDGLRYTDATTMDVVQAILCGKVNKDLVSQLSRLGGVPLSQTAADFLQRGSCLAKNGDRVIIVKLLHIVVQIAVFSLTGGQQKPHVLIVPQCLLGCAA